MKNIGKMVGKGWSAEVFEWGSDKVVKLFFKDYSQELINQEKIISKKVSDAGLPAPKIFETVEINGRTGIIIERLFGKTLIEILPFKIFKSNYYAGMVADIHAQIHRTKIEGLPTQRELFRGWITPTPYITDDQKKKVLDLLDELPDGNSLCHNDFHPPNVIMTKNGPVVIDWASARLGDPMADLAYSEMVIRMGDLTSFPKGRMLIRIGRKKFSRQYRENYFKTMPHDEEVMERWRPILVAARLVYKFKSEIPILQRMLGKLL